MTDTTHIAVLGDVHGHLQLALSLCARWQHQRGQRWDAVLLCGDVGTFTAPEQLDSATRSHARTDPGELEFMTQWSTRPQAPWLAWIFKPKAEGGLGLTCPVLMTHGNHEGFSHLAALNRASIPVKPVPVATLPGVDTNGFIRWIPSGWRVSLSGDVCVGAVGGIEPEQRHAAYHPMAFLDDDAVAALASQPPHSIDLLITHQGPAVLQGEQGANVLDLLVEAQVARLWCHGHATPHPAAATVGSTTLVPLSDVHK
ncbi:MAG: metallophosphoesterase, partial [Myxococcota bacterium]